MIFRLMNAADPSPSDVALSTGGVDPGIRGNKKNKESNGALRRRTVHHEPELAVPKSSEEKTDSASSPPAPFRRKSPSAKTAGNSIHSNFL